MYALPYWMLHWLRQAAINARRANHRRRYLALVGRRRRGERPDDQLGFAFVLVFRSIWWLALPMLALMVLPVVANPLIRFVLVPAGPSASRTTPRGSAAPAPIRCAYALCAAAWASRDGRRDRVGRGAARAAQAAGRRRES